MDDQRLLSLDQAVDHLIQERLVCWLAVESCCLDCLLLRTASFDRHLGSSVNEVVVEMEQQRLSWVLLLNDLLETHIALILDHPDVDIHPPLLCTFGLPFKPLLDATLVQSNESLRLGGAELLILPELPFEGGDMFLLLIEL